MSRYSKGTNMERRSNRERRSCVDCHKDLAWYEVYEESCTCGSTVYESAGSQYPFAIDRIVQLMECAGANLKQ